MNTKNKFVIALDVMGGDNAPQSVVEGVELFLKKRKDFSFLLYGNQMEISKFIKNENLINKHCKIIHTEEVIGGDWKVIESLRKGKETSMWQAIKAVADKEADAVVSAGNTGALMAISKMLLKMLPNIDRPAIVQYIPTSKNPCVVLDLGANATCTSESLAQFAVMGDAFAKIIIDVKNPRVAILNIGSEDMKGNIVVQEAAQIVKDNNKINYIGFIEGDKIFSGDVDVVVTDGFSGNIALKTLEGTAKFLMNVFKSSIKSSFLSKIGFIFLLPQLLKIRKRLDTRRYNGAMLIGLGGISVKSHGGSDKIAIFSAILATSKLVEGRVNDRIQEELQNEI